jgi:hypothetical protein
MASIVSDTMATTSLNTTLDIAACILKFLDEERDKLVRIMKDAREDLGFQDACMLQLSFGHVLWTLCI